MKKFARTLLIAVLCLMMAVPAFAELKPYNLGLKDARMVRGANAYYVTTSNYCTLYSLDGVALTSAGYGAFTDYGGYLQTFRYDVEGMNCYGLLDVKGNVVVPFEYNMIENNENWAVAIALVEANSDSYDYTNYSKDAFYNISKVGVYYLPEGKCVAELTRDQYLDHRFQDNCINIADRATGTVTTYDAGFNALGTVSDLYDDSLNAARVTTYRDNGRYGLKDAAGNVIMEPAYQSISESYDCFLIYDNELAGLADAKGNVLVEAKYGKVMYMNALPSVNGSTYGYCALGNYYCVTVNDKVGFIDAAGNETFAPKYGKNNVSVNGASYTLEDLEGNIIICAADGNEATISGYKAVRALDYASGMYYQVTDENNSYGLIDWHGNEILPCEYSYILASGDGKYVMVSKDFSTFDILMLEYPEFAAAPVETPAEAPAAPVEEPAEEPAAPVETPVEAPAEEPAAQPAESAGGDYTAVTGLLNTAITLLSGDVSANGAAITALLQNAAAIAPADVAALLNSAVTLLNTDAAANASAAQSLLQTAMTLLK